MGDYVAGLRSSGVERRNFTTLVLFSTAVALASYVGARTGWSLFEGSGLQSKVWEWLPASLFAVLRA